MNVVVRVDASSVIGTGHVIRCLTLAQVLRARGADIRFVCRDHPGNMIDFLQQQGMLVTVLPPPKSTASNFDDYATWVGATQIEDAQQTIEILREKRPDWLIVDHYGLDIEWERELRPHAARGMVIDDLSNRPHECDLLLDQNYSDLGEHRYRYLVPSNCRLLIGPRYALLHPEYLAYHNMSQQREGVVRRVIVYFGGVDPDNATGMALEVLTASEFEHLEVDIVIGARSLHRPQLEQQAQGRPHTNLWQPKPHLADMIAQADLAVGAGGATTWERMCLGLPSIVVSIAPNQKPACEALARSGLIYYLGDFSEVEPEDLRRTLADCCAERNRTSLCDMAARSQLLVDPFGAHRVAEAIFPTPVDHLVLRSAAKSDIQHYFNWVNDPEVRRQSFRSEPITWDEHQDWFARKLASEDSLLYVLQAGSLPVGQIRFDCIGDEARIDYSLDPLVRGRGWAARLVALGVDSLRKAARFTLRAEVKASNEVSGAVFRRLGFREARPNADTRVFLSSTDRVGIAS